MKTVSIGPTTIVAWLTSLVALLPELIRAIEGATVHATVTSIAGAVVLVVSLIGRYVQSLKL